MYSTESPENINKHLIRLSHLLGNLGHHSERTATTEHSSCTADNTYHPALAQQCLQLADLKPGEHVLDVACGTGQVTCAAAVAVGSAGHVTGVDLSEGMLQQVRQLSSLAVTASHHMGTML